MTAAVHPPATVPEAGATRPGMPGPSRRQPELALRAALRESTDAATAGHRLRGIAARTPNAATDGLATHHHAPGRASQPLPPTRTDTAAAGPATPAAAGDGQ